MSPEDPFAGSGSPEEKKDDRQEQLDYRVYEINKTLGPLFETVYKKAQDNVWWKVVVECSIVLNSGQTIDVDIIATDTTDKIKKTFEDELSNKLATVDLTYDRLEKINLTMRGIGETGDELPGSVSGQYERE